MTHDTRASQPVVLHESDRAFEGLLEQQPGAVRWRTLISADRTPTHAMTVGIAEIEPGTSANLRPHRHAQDEVYYVVSGEGAVTIGKDVHAIRPGSCVFIPGGVPHQAQNQGRDLLRILYVFPTDAFSDVRYEFPDSE